MEHFISNLKAQTYKSFGGALLISFIVIYLFWNSENFVNFFSGNGPFLLLPLTFFIPVFINLAIYVFCAALLISKKGIAHGLMLGIIFLVVSLVPSFINAAFNNQMSATFLVYSMIIIDNAIRYIIPATVLSYLRKH